MIDSYNIFDFNNVDSEVTEAIRVKVVCKTNKLNQISDRAIVERLRNNINLENDCELGVKIGQEYDVYGIIFRDDSPWFYLCEDEDDEYPVPFPADFFDIVVKSFPDYWQLSFRCTNGIPRSEIVFPEWASDPMFYEKLVDGSEKEVGIFYQYKMLMKKEIQ